MATAGVFLLMRQASTARNVGAGLRNDCRSRYSMVLLVGSRGARYAARARAALHGNVARAPSVDP